MMVKAMNDYGLSARMLLPEYRHILKWLTPNELAALEALVWSLEPRQKYLLVTSSLSNTLPVIALSTLLDAAAKSPADL